MEISEGRGMGAEAVPCNDEEVERAVADTGLWGSQRHRSRGYSLLSTNGTFMIE